MAKGSSTRAGADVKAISRDLRRMSERLEALQASADRIEEVVAVLVQPELLTSLRSVFKDARQLRAYQLSDGKNSTREIGKRVGVDQKTISRWWRAWKKDFRIVEKAGSRGQFRGRYALADLASMQAELAAVRDGTQVEQAPLF
jgi:hypothetical protein